MSTFSQKQFYMISTCLHLPLFFIFCFHTTSHPTTICPVPLLLFFFLLLLVWVCVSNFTCSKKDTQCLLDKKQLVCIQVKKVLTINIKEYVKSIGTTIRHTAASRKVQCQAINYSLIVKKF